MSRIPTDDLSQENDTQEQRDDDQAQDVADDAMFISTDLSEDSEHGGVSNPAAGSRPSAAEATRGRSAISHAARRRTGSYPGFDPALDHRHAWLRSMPAASATA